MPQKVAQLLQAEGCTEGPHSRYVYGPCLLFCLLLVEVQAAPRRVSTNSGLDLRSMLLRTIATAL